MIPAGHRLTLAKRQRSLLEFDGEMMLEHCVKEDRTDGSFKRGGRVAGRCKRTLAENGTIIENFHRPRTEGGGDRGVRNGTGSCMWKEISHRDTAFKFERRGRCWMAGWQSIKGYINCRTVGDKLTNCPSRSLRSKLPSWSWKSSSVSKKITKVFGKSHREQNAKSSAQIHELETSKSQRVPRYAVRAGDEKL